MEYYSAIENNKILPFAATWMNIVLTEISQTKTNTILYHLYVESKKYINECMCKTETDSQIQKTNL